MKIERLHFKNINSLKGEHEVNFNESPLNSGGLFAITGPTGSGKSSLLDAICLALYARTPRISSVTKNKIEQDGSILTKYQKEAYAKVEFSCNAGTFISTWSISTNRNNKLREYDMDLWDPVTETSFSEKKSEVLTEIQRLIGLSYDQFVKSVLLSQGEFASLLQSNEKERSELLEKITNTSIYRQIGRKVFEKYKSLDAKIAEQKTLLKDLKEKLLDEKELQEKEHLKAQLGETESLQQKTLSQYEKNLEQLKSKEKLDQELDTESKRLNSYTEELSEFQEKNGERLKQHAKTLAFEEELLSYNTLTDKKEAHSEAIEDFARKRAQIQNELESLKSKAAKLLKKDLEEAKVEPELTAFLKSYQNLDSERKLKRNDYKSKMDALNKELDLLGLQFQKQPVNEFEDKLQTRLEATEQRIKSLNIETKADETLEESIKAQNQFLRQLKEAKHEDKSIKDLEEQALKLDTQLKKEQEELSKFPELISTQETTLKAAEEKVNHLETEKENQSLRLEVEELRKKLVENEACPVCGSEQHPFAEHAPGIDSELDKKLQHQKQKLQLISHELAKLKAEQVTTSKRASEIKEELRLIQTNLQNKKEAFTKNYQSVLSEAKNKSLQALETITEQQIENLEELKTLQLEAKALKISVSTLKELDEIGKEGSRLKAEMEDLYAGENLEELVSKMTSDWIRLKSNLASTQESLDKEKNSLSSVENKLLKLQASLEPKIKASAFLSISEANSSRMKAADYQALSQRLNELSERLQIQKEKIKGLKTQIKNLRFECFTDKNEAELALNRLKDDLKKVRTELEEVNRQLKNNSDRIDRLKSIEDSIVREQKANKTWEILNSLIGDAEGHKFNKFAQDLSLQRLIYLGNKRLKHLNSRYELDRYLPNEDKDQLYIIDHHMGGMRRSVKTLSGGETFLMSLALALGLSDLASRNVEINSLFIDEGFGTLDPETLDVTLDTLERLQAESNKTIGIISHVSSLKERIQTQIVLDRNAQGYSSLQVVG
ncbi:AAA family ATPase [Psychroflexus sp. YR1-1]|uniref:AAA family ATPase n=1 Tax=Psychroflexus aurantiacus TaxID=2709310 RepID=A0A6B3R0I7_9FLAO|nr:AAA family ATPase [Psychroflexus aurantiacus]NEV93538.1 AAA family ATPase [Psychroflexus aurantiacus]